MIRPMPTVGLALFIKMQGFVSDVLVHGIIGSRNIRPAIQPILFMKI